MHRMTFLWLLAITVVFFAVVIYSGYQDQVTMRVTTTVYTQVGEPVTTATSIVNDAWPHGEGLPVAGMKLHQVGVTGLFASGYPYSKDYEVLTVRRVTLLQMIGLQQ